MSIDNSKKHKNIDRQLIHDEMAQAATFRAMSITQYARMCGLDSHFYSDVLKARKAPEHLLRQLARDVHKTGIKRHWRDYLLLDPESNAAEPEQLSLFDTNENTNTGALSDISDRLAAIEKELKQVRADQQVVSTSDDFRILLSTSGEITPKHGVLEARFNLKLSSESAAYLDEEAHRLRISKTEFINRLLCVYAKKYPHK